MEKGYRLENLSATDKCGNEARSIAFHYQPALI
jgi:hypothetical protein